MHQLKGETLVNGAFTATKTNDSKPHVNGVGSPPTDPFENTYQQPPVQRHARSAREHGEEKFVLSSLEKNYMKVTLNNVKKHNLLTVGVSLGLGWGSGDKEG